MRAKSNEWQAVQAAVRTVTRAREICPLYAADAAPLHEGQVADLMRQAGCYVRVYPFQSSVGGFALGYRGVPGVALNANAPRHRRGFAARHELHHVLAGEVHEPVCMADTGYLTCWERAADLFALADLVPGWTLRRLRSGRELAHEVVQSVVEYGEGLPDGWVADRARLRLLLFREHAF